MLPLIFPILLILAALAIVVGQSIGAGRTRSSRGGAILHPPRPRPNAPANPCCSISAPTWCPPCQEMRRTTWSDPQVAQDLGGYVPVQLDLDHNPWPNSLPSARSHLDLIAPDGQVIASTEGEMNPDEFRAWLASARTHPTLSSRFHASEDARK